MITFMCRQVYCTPLLITLLRDFKITAFFTKADPQPEVSLSVATAFFPNTVRRAAMTQYGNEQNAGDPLQHLAYTQASPYLIPLEPT